MSLEYNNHIRALMSNPKKCAELLPDINQSGRGFFDYLFKMRVGLSNFGIHVYQRKPKDPEIYEVSFKWDSDTYGVIVYYPKANDWQISKFLFSYEDIRNRKIDLTPSASRY